MYDKRTAYDDLSCLIAHPISLIGGCCYIGYIFPGVPRPASLKAGQKGVCENLSRGTRQTVQLSATPIGSESGTRSHLMESSKDLSYGLDIRSL